MSARHAKTRSARKAFGTTAVPFVSFVGFVCLVSFVRLAPFVVYGAANDADVDRIFSRWNTTTTPGCAVGAAVDGKPVLTKGYGMADLEHEVKITPETIFEAGSVSKQFTAAAVLLLARDGKLSIDDPVKKYLPEVPDSAAPVTIRHMLTHTSGLRDWGSVEAIAGWPRTRRAYTQAHVLDIVSRQTALNFTPGTRWSYSNTGFNLAAMIVSRISGMTFAAFTEQRLFAPIGMSHTSWRDDFTRVLRNRAVAYADRGGEFHTEMPFENVYGNGGLLTTVGDLLKWNDNFSASKIADAEFETMQQQSGTFTDGRTHGYAFGLRLTTAHGVRVVEHSGSTAGYSAHLLRLPDEKISVAVLCNATTARATEYAHAVADLFLPAGAKTGPEPPKPLPASSTELFRNADNGLVLLAAPSGSTWTMAANRLTVKDRYGVDEVFERVPRWTPTAADLEALTGTYVSDEAQTTLVVSFAQATISISRRPDAVFTMTPLYADAFRAPQLGTIVFRRDAAGRVDALSVVDDRVWDLRFARQPRPAKSSQQAS